MSLKSEYTIDLVIQDDKNKDAVRELEKRLGDLSKNLKKDSDSIGITKALENARFSADKLTNSFNEMARDQELDFSKISKAYERSVNKAIADLEKQYAQISEELKNAQNEYNDNVKYIDALTEKLKDQNISLEKRNSYEEKINILKNKNAKINTISLESQIRENRNLRYKLKAASQIAAQEKTNAKNNKLNELYQNRKLAKTREEKKEINEQIKQQKAYIKTVEQAEKTAQKLNKETGRIGKAWDLVCKHANRFNKIAQFAYNASGMIGGAARTAVGAAKAGIGVGRAVGSGVQMVAGAADEFVERERLANRIKGIDSSEERIEILRQIRIQTGADYGQIVDAITNVQALLGKSLNSDEIVRAASIEIRYPGMSQAFISSSTDANESEFYRYANKMKAMQTVTGASDAQIQESAQFMKNVRASDVGITPITDLQTIYLGLQTSGAFDSQEELERAFRGFMRIQRGSKKSAFETAKGYDWSSHIYNSRNRLQAENAFKNVDWNGIGTKVNDAAKNNTAPEMTDAEKLSMSMRDIEDKRNQLLIKLIPALLPLVEELSKVMDQHGKTIIDGFVKLVKVVIPMFEPLFTLLERVLKVCEEDIFPLIKSALDWWKDDPLDENTREMKFYTPPIKGKGLFEPPGVSGNARANGGLIFGKAIVGERAFQPEMVLPLDYSRATRSANIIENVNQTFNMTGTQTTALSLAQAVQTRDFRRATSQSAFLGARGGSLCGW